MLINQRGEEFLWSQKYRPRTVEDCVLPADLKATFSAFVKSGDVPNLLLAGPSGLGKTTVALAMIDQVGGDAIMINGSLNGNIDTLRNEISNFASSVSLTSGRKYVVLDEADYLTNNTQPALRNFMEEYSKNCGFVLTCNYVNRIIPELQGRCSVVNFAIKKGDAMKLAAQFFKRVKWILESEGVAYDEQAVVAVVQKFYPNWRRVLNELQTYAACGKIDAGVLTSLEDVSLDELVGFMRKKDFTSVRRWVGESLDADHTTVFRKFYDKARDLFEPEYVPALVMTIAQYQQWAAFSVDQEINLAAFLAEVMVQAAWRK